MRQDYSRISVAVRRRLDTSGFGLPNVFFHAGAVQLVGETCLRVKDTDDNSVQRWFIQGIRFDRPHQLMLQIACDRVPGPVPRVEIFSHVLLSFPLDGRHPERAWFEPESGVAQRCPSGLYPVDHDVAEPWPGVAAPADQSCECLAELGRRDANRNALDPAPISWPIGIA